MLQKWRNDKWTGEWLYQGGMFAVQIWILTLFAVYFLDTLYFTEGPWMSHGGKTTVFAPVSKEKPVGCAKANVTIGSKTPVAGGNVVRDNVTIWLAVKPFSYCRTVGCWRKKSRRGRPGPVGLKDHSNPVEDTHSGGGGGGHSNMLLFNKLSP